MSKSLTRGPLLVLTLALSACNQTTGAQVASTVARLDPTGIASSAVGIAQSVAPEAEDGTSSSIRLSQFAVRLQDVAAGHMERPSLTGALDSQMNQAMATQGMALASTIAGAAVSGAMSGGIGLLAAAPSIAMQAASAGAMTAQLAAARERAQSAMAQAEAEREATRVVPQADRPIEAQAILNVIDGPGGRSTTWRNPETGSSGKVSIKDLPKGDTPGDFVCRLVNQEWKGPEGTRKGAMIACRQGGEWYDLS